MFSAALSTTIYGLIGVEGGMKDAMHARGDGRRVRCPGVLRRGGHASRAAGGARLVQLP